jgi:hypothetical protein
LICVTVPPARAPIRAALSGVAATVAWARIWLASVYTNVLHFVAVIEMGFVTRARDGKLRAGRLDGFDVKVM